MASSSKITYNIDQIIANNIDDFIFIYDPNFKCEYTNIKVDLEELDISNESKRLHHFIHPDDVTPMIELLKTTFKLGYGIADIRIKYRDKIFKWYEMRSKRFKDASKENKVILFSREITKFKKMEQKIKARQARFYELTETLPEIRYWKFLQSKNGIAAYQKTREMLELVIDNIPQLIYWKDTNLNYLGCNQNFATLTGIKNTINIIGKRDEDLRWIKKALPKIQEIEKRVMANNKAEYHTLEFLILHNGNKIWFEVNRIPLHNLDGKVVGILSTYRDITIRRVAEQKLRESEKKYRNIIENTKDVIVITGLDGKFLFVSPQFSEMLGKEINLQTELFQNIHPDDIQHLTELYSKAVSEKNVLVTEEVEFRAKHLNGHYIWLSSSSKNYYDDNGNLIGFITLLRDVTEKKIAEQKLKKSQEELQLLNRVLEQKVLERTRELKKSEQQYRTTIDSVGDSLHVIDRDLRIILMNQTLKNWLEDLNIDTNIIDRKIADVFPFLLENIYEEYKQVFDTGKPLITTETTFLPEFDIITETRKFPIFTNHKVAQVITIIRDITKRKKIEQKLIESERKLREQNIELRKLDQIKNDFITMAAHELKTPLISISGYTDYILLKHNNVLSYEILEDLKTVQRNIKRLEILMDQLLEVMKIDEGRLQLQMERTNVSKIINNCLDELSYQINEKNLEIILNVDYEILINIDPTRISLVFTNLISNAIKFTPEYGWIEITAKKENDKHFFKIKDNGIGLTKDELGRLFKKFERIKQPIGTKDTGTGLGLYISKGIVEAHNGEIWVKSEGLNKGTTFTFTLPS